ncbi:MAG: sodium-dependent transporter [Gammaproteobacteria bacterium]|nr:sodium-dependent transporter [Gammaproteobacteria bacterium]
MINLKQSQHEYWSNSLTYTLAATGAAVGLGNIWKFPYIMGENGGGAFVLVYLACVVFIGIPMMMSEVMIGRRGRSNPGTSVKRLAQESKVSSRWQAVGWLGALTGYLILSFYIVIAGWALAYVFKALSGDFISQDAAGIEALFVEHLKRPMQLIYWSAAILTATVIVVAKGVQRGLERTIKYAMPLMIILLVITALYSGFSGDFVTTLEFMFKPDFSKLTINSVVIALGHSFFTLSLASGIMLAYGSYMPQDISIYKTSLYIAAADTIVALLAGLAIFPIVFSNNLAPSAGPGLIFQTLPIAFGQMPGGVLFGTLFFVMLVIAAFTSTIALLESSVAYLVEHWSLSRWQASTLSGLVLWFMSLATVFSLSGAPWTQLEINGHSYHIFSILDYTASNIMLPIGGLLLAIFVGWRVTSAISQAELKCTPLIYRIWLMSMKWLAPIAISILFLQLIGVVSL